MKAKINSESKVAGSADGPVVQQNNEPQDGMAGLAADQEKLRLFLEKVNERRPLVGHWLEDSQMLIGKNGSLLVVCDNDNTCENLNRAPTRIALVEMWAEIQLPKLEVRIISMP